MKQTQSENTMTESCAMFPSEYLKTPEDSTVFGMPTELLRKTENGGTSPYGHAVSIQQRDENGVLRPLTLFPENFGTTFGIKAATYGGTPQLSGGRQKYIIDYNIDPDDSYKLEDKPDYVPSKHGKEMIDALDEFQRRAIKHFTSKEVLDSLPKSLRLMFKNFDPEDDDQPIAPIYTQPKVPMRVNKSKDRPRDKTKPFQLNKNRVRNFKDLDIKLYKASSIDNLSDLTQVQNPSAFVDKGCYMRPSILFDQYFVKDKAYLQTVIDEAIVVEFGKGTSKTSQGSVLKRLGISSVPLAASGEEEKEEEEKEEEPKSSITEKTKRVSERIAARRAKV